jgi:peptide/nickel transport system ATP-binding protein
MNLAEEVIKVEDLKGYYRGSFGIVHAVDGVSLTVNKGDIVGIAGESGSGKTSLAELITGSPIQLLKYEGGQVSINNVSIYKLNEDDVLDAMRESKTHISLLEFFHSHANSFIYLFIYLFILFLYLYIYFYIVFYFIFLLLFSLFFFIFLYLIYSFIFISLFYISYKSQKENDLQRVTDHFKKLVNPYIRTYVRHEGVWANIHQKSLKNIQQDVIRKKVLCKVIAYVPQASQNSLNPVKRIRDFMLDAMKERIGVKAKNKEQVLQRVAEHFKQLGLEKAVIDKFPHELSGGMKQRVVLGISTLWNPLILIADEPTSALDVTTQQLLIETFKHLKKIGIVETILFISHDIPILAQICNTCMIMYAGRIVEKANMDDIIRDPQHPYTKMLINSIACFNPDGSAETILEAIPGRPPDLRNPPKGCRFYPRCPSRLEKCKENYPPFFIARKNNNPVACWLYEGISDK